MYQAGSLESVSDGPGPSKKAKRECKYQQEWQSHGMLPSARGPTFARCKCCNTDININNVSLLTIKSHFFKLIVPHTFHLAYGTCFSRGDITQFLASSTSKVGFKLSCCT